MHSIKIFDHIICRILIPASLTALVLAGLLILPANPALAYTARFLYEGNGYTAGKDLSRPLGIFYDSSTKEIYVADTGNRQIVVFDSNAMPVYRFFHHVTVDGEKQLGEPKSIAVDHNGRIFVTDALVPYLDVLDHNGRQLAAIDPPVDGCAEYIRFDNVALGPDGRIFATITCAGEKTVAVINESLEIENILRLEPEVGGSSCVTNIGVDDAGRIYITDPCADLMIQVYTPEGDFESGFGRHDAGFENFSHPTDIVIMKSGEMWIVDTIRQVVSCFTPEGEFVSYVGGKGDQPGAFQYPVGVATDGENRLFVVERAGNRFQCFQIVSDDPETASK